MKQVFVPIVVFIVIVLSSCVRTTKNYPEFVGEWYGETQYCQISITIPVEGKATYYKLCDTVYVEAEGYPFLKSKFEVLKIGRKEFEITPKQLYELDEITAQRDKKGQTVYSYVPYLEDDSLRIILDGIYFTLRDSLVD